MNLKSEIIHVLLNELQKKVSEYNRLVISIKESRDQETKSTSGDKYETGRAMVQIELEKAEQQLERTLGLMAEIKKIDEDKCYTFVEFGSLVATNNHQYLVSIGIGKVQGVDDNIYAISLASPIGQALKGKVVDDIVLFQGEKVTILKIE